MKLRSVAELKDLKGKRVLLRADFNVPVTGGKVGSEEDWRLKKTLPTIEWLMKKGAKVVLASHMGRPEGKKVAALKLDPVARRLSTLLGKPVKKLPESVGAKAEKEVAAMAPGDVVLLENLRFNKGEDANDPKFAAKLAKLADIYVDDSFATCHRAAASLVAITKLLPSYAGLLLLRELDALDAVTKKPAHPYVVVMGGSKVSTKIGVIERMLQIADRVLLGGALITPFFKAMGFGIGKSLLDKEDLKAAEKLMASKHWKRAILPHDLVVGEPKKTGSHAKAVDLHVTPFDLTGPTRAILDIGPKTVSAYASYLRSAKTIVWNGPLGWFEVPKYAHATLALGRLVAVRSRGKAFGVVGGGESVMALQRTGLSDCVDHVSTGGGAMLEYLEGRELPGIVALAAAHKNKK